ncbi:MAG: hypothetical protein JNL01_08600 [Bdellovibrionales bacterium]|nr:hypothetical protein [Bdellovibrionales bacterium]
MMKNSVLSLVAFFGLSSLAQAQPMPSVSACQVEALAAAGLLSTFDTDKNGKFSVAEAKGAYETFAPYIKKYTGQDSDRVNLGIFTYVLRYEALPKQTLTGRLKLAVWLAKKRFWKFEKTKGQVINAMMAVFCN